MLIVDQVVGTLIIHKQQCEIATCHLEMSVKVTDEWPPFSHAASACKLWKRYMNDWVLIIKTSIQDGWNVGQGDLWVTPIQDLIMHYQHVNFEISWMIEPWSS